jgi:chromosome segregation protein
MIKLAIEDQSELIAQEISSLQAKVTRQMTKREELVEQRNKEIIRLRGLELDISSYQDGKTELEAQLEAIRHEDQKAARASVADKTGYDKKEAVLRKDLQELDAQLVEAQSVMGAEIDSAAGQVSRQDRVIERLVSKKSEVSVLLKGSKRQLAGYRKELERMEKDYRLSYGSLDGPKADYGAVSIAGVAQLEAKLSMTQQLDANSVALAAEIGDRLAQLRTQRDDLIAAVKDLEELISQLDKDIQSRFATGFKAINTQFGHFFHKLFGGGTGKLVYEARDDGEYGIEITATPPGKRTQQLAMLSGGERSLGAIALLAAIMAVNPSPFVVLDEVDAALDDANSQKFNQVLQELGAKTQLIVITHNHETMQAARQLIGITSDAQGVAMAVSAQLSPTASI